MKWDKLAKEKIQYGAAICSIVFGFTLTMMGFFASPVGEVHTSVITILGETLIFGGSIFGISLHYNNELHNFKDEVRKELNN